MLDAHLALVDPWTNRASKKNGNTRKRHQLVAIRDQFVAIRDPFVAT